MTQYQPPLFGMETSGSADPGALERAAEATIGALRLQHAIQPWHELDCQIVLDLSRAVESSRGIAKSQMFGALLQARAKLPEPIVSEQNDELIVYEAGRDLEWQRVHGYALPAPDAPDAAES